MTGPSQPGQPVQPEPYEPGLAGGLAGHLPPTGDAPTEELSEEVIADRRFRANRATRGGLAAILCLEAFVVLLVPRAIAQGHPVSTTTTLILVALAIVLVTAGFLLKRPWGIGLASVLQLALVATIALVPAIVVVVAFFLFIWWYLLRTRHQLVGTPSGWRMFVN